MSCYVRVFQGAPGPDGGRGERVSRINVDFKWARLCVTAAKICVNVFKIPRREQSGRRGSKVPVETEVQEEIR